MPSQACPVLADITARFPSPIFQLLGSQALSTKPHSQATAHPSGFLPAQSLPYLCIYKQQSEVAFGFPLPLTLLFHDKIKVFVFLTGLVLLRH